MYMCAYMYSKNNNVHGIHALVAKYSVTQQTRAPL